MWNQIISGLAGFLLLFGVHIDTPPMVRGDATASSQSALQSKVATASSKTSVDAFRTWSKSLGYRTAQKEVESQNTWKKKNEEFTKKAATLRDAEKKKILMTIQEQLHTFYTKRIDTYTKQLSISSEILTTLSQKASLTGKDLKRFNEMFILAEQAIRQAADMVTVQATKAYGITITSELTLKQDVQATRTAMETDLLKVHSQMVVVQDAMKKVLSEYRVLVEGEPVVTAPVSSNTATGGSALQE